MDLLSLLPFVLIIAVFYLLIIRPNAKRRREQAALLAAVQPGDAIMTTAGMYGTVVATTDTDVTVEIAPGVEVRLVKAAIGQVIKPESSAEAAESTDDDGPGKVA